MVTHWQATRLLALRYAIVILPRHVVGYHTTSPYITNAIIIRYAIGHYDGHIVIRRYHHEFIITGWFGHYIWLVTCFAIDDGY